MGVVRSGHFWQLGSLRRVKDWVQLFCARCLNDPWGGRYQKAVVSHRRRKQI